MIPTNEDEGVVVRVTVQPLVRWLWIGGGLMAVGTALALVPGKRRRPTAATSALPSNEPPAMDDPDKFCDPVPAEAAT